MENLKINLQMDKTIQDYPLTSLPTKFNKRTGKAKKSLYEKLDLTLYESSTEMLFFHTNSDRIQPWIKSLDMLYYDNLGRDGSEYVVVWADEPTKWTDRNSIGNLISIELHTIHEQQNTLLYKLTFFITTDQVIIKVDSTTSITEPNIPAHNDISFEKNTLETESHDSDNTCVKTVVSEQNEDGKDIKVNSTDDNNNSSEHNLHNAPKEPKQVVGHVGENISATCSMKAEASRLEQSLVDTIAKMENNQSVTSSNIITHIDECKSYSEGLTKMMKSIVSDNKVSEDVISLRNKIKVLNEENQSIPLQLKNEQSATLLIKCQFEDALT
ncbi:unnamed protein product [Mytilus coruscus]|uniref:Uncharacterized protein n=1 Tax=Mytilus coruscus TaxID=42192 RepID=A0A6J8AV14_MYTCO|nr:unnamed protein product [Mytilus coruscus]